MPVVAIDYMRLARRAPGSKENPITMLIVRKYTNKLAHVVNSNGAEDYHAVGKIARELANFGYSHSFFTSDQEPAMLSFKEAVIRRATALKVMELP